MIFRSFFCPCVLSRCCCYAAAFRKRKYEIFLINTINRSLQFQFYCFDALYRRHYSYNVTVQLPLYIVHVDVTLFIHFISFRFYSWCVSSNLNALSIVEGLKREINRKMCKKVSQKQRNTKMRKTEYKCNELLTSQIRTCTSVALRHFIKHRFN